MNQQNVTFRGDPEIRTRVIFLYSAPSYQVSSSYV